MLALISYLVEIARLNNGHLRLMREDANIEEVITDAANRWKLQNTSKPLGIEMNFADPIFNMDKAQIRQVISHLLTFASIRVTAGTVSLSASDSESNLKVRIQSNRQKPLDKSEMDSAMIGFITSALIKLHGGQLDNPQETDDGLLLKFSLPREPLRSGPTGGGDWGCRKGSSVLLEVPRALEECRSGATRGRGREETARRALGWD